MSSKAVHGDQHVTEPEPAPIGAGAQPALALLLDGCQPPSSNEARRVTVAWWSTNARAQTARGKATRRTYEAGTASIPARDSTVSAPSSATAVGGKDGEKTL